jgi:ATP-dependent RNA helicase RhlE
MSFQTFNLDPAIMSGIRDLKYTEPTPIQAQAMPPILQGRDIIGIAQTGTGKTAAFVLPILQRLIKRPRSRMGALIISPTRELAEQTCDSFRELGKHTGLRVQAIYGGVGMDAQVRGLRNGTEIVVACPGRFLDHVWKGNVDFPSLEVLVIDEADRMFDMGFLPDIHNILDCIIRPHQTLLFSATMPDDIRRLVREVLQNPVTVQIGISAPAKSVSHALYPVAPHLKPNLLEELLRQTKTESVLVFTRTKHRAERLHQRLNRIGYRVASLQGNLSQGQRDAALDGFREGSVKILVATDIASRGLDISHISHVINFDMPDTTDAYIHRIGRTGRMENTGQAFTLVTSEDAEMVRALERIFKAPLERRKLAGFNYEAAASLSELRARPPAARNSPKRVHVRSRA